MLPELALISLWLLGLGLLAFVALVYLFVRVARAPKPIPGEERGKAPAETYAFGDLDESLPPFHRKRTGYDEQSPGWRQAAKEVGKRLAGGGVHTIFYSHGTFVGHDPIGVTKVIQDLHPELGQKLAERTSNLIKKGSDWLAKDVGNFPLEYIQLCHEGFNTGIHYRNYRWSSGNNHFARLEGAIELFIALAAAMDQSFDPKQHRFLLIGHSHAGQVFALFTQLMGDGDLRTKLHELILRESLVPRQSLEKARDALRHVAIDFVTLGTPPVYPWSLGPRHRLLHIINHRGEEPLGGNLTGLLMTKSGDYIQQYGASGSDTLALTKRARQLNITLDEILGRGISVSAWFNNLLNQRRLPSQGFTYLIDFKDEGRIKPNFLTTFMGHGVYTRYSSMLYLHRLIADFFYGGK